MSERVREHSAGASGAAPEVDAVGLLHGRTMPGAPFPYASLCHKTLGAWSSPWSNCAPRLPTAVHVCSHLSRELHETISFCTRMERAAAAAGLDCSGSRQDLAEQAWFAHTLRVGCCAAGGADALADALAEAVGAIPHLAEGSGLTGLDK